MLSTVFIYLCTFTITITRVSIIVVSPLYDSPYYYFVLYFYPNMTTEELKYLIKYLHLLHIFPIELV